MDFLGIMNPSPLTNRLLFDIVQKCGASKLPCSPNMISFRHVYQPAPMTPLAYEANEQVEQNAHQRNEAAECRDRGAT